MRGMSLELMGRVAVAQEGRAPEARFHVCLLWAVLSSWAV